MVKKNHNGTKNGGGLEKLREPLLLCISLRIGAWRELFSDQANMIIISEALNECAVNKIFTLAGYLLTSRRVFLVIYPKGSDSESMLFSFCNSIRSAVRHYMQGLKYSGQWPNQPWDGVPIDELLKHPFHRQYCINDHLARLVTGRRVNLPYYSPHLDMLKDKVRQAAFCSAIEYRGGEGPVIIEKLKKILH
jgi:hypothetical protein